MQIKKKNIYIYIYTYTYIYINILTILNYYLRIDFSNNNITRKLFWSKCQGTSEACSKGLKTRSWGERHKGMVLTEGASTLGYTGAYKVNCSFFLRNN